MERRSTNIAEALQIILGKVFTKLIQNRMNQYVEKRLGKNKSGSGQDEAQLISSFQCDKYLKKSIEHNQKVFMNFKDLKQAFDSILACWNVKSAAKCNKTCTRSQKLSDYIK